MNLRKDNRELLKNKKGEKKPRGYPDVYFDRQTWDFKGPTFQHRNKKSENLFFPNLCCIFASVMSWHDIHIERRRLPACFGSH